MKNDLPKDDVARVIFCFAYGDAFDGDHEEALARARFAVLYCVGMGSTRSMGLDLKGDGSFELPPRRVPKEQRS